MKADDKRFQFEEDYQKRANHQSYLNTRTIARPRGINRNRTTLQENGECVINGKRNETHVLRIPWRVMSLQEPRKLKVLKRLYRKTFSVTKLTLDALNTHFSLYGNAEWVTDGNGKSITTCKTHHILST